MRIKSGKKDVRNVWCSCYSKCLDAATATGGDGTPFTCAECEREFDRTEKPRDGQEARELSLPCMALLAAIFQGAGSRVATYRVRDL